MATKTTTPPKKTASKPAPAVPAKKKDEEKPKGTALTAPPKSSGAVPAVKTTIDLTADAGSGQENMTSDDYAVPRLNILQKGSPEVDKDNDAYIEGAEVGEIINTVTKERYSGSDGILLLAVSYARNHIEWKLRKNGGGFVKNHGISPAILDQCKVDPETHAHIHHSGNEIVPTAEYFCFLVEFVNGKLVWSPVVLSMAKTQLKKARGWNTMMGQLQVERPDGNGTFNPAIYYRAYKLTTVPESNDKGSWYGWNIEPADAVLEWEGGENLYLAARDFRQKIAAGAIKAVAPDADPGAGPSDDGDAM